VILFAAQLCAVTEKYSENTGYMSVDNLIMQISSQKPRNEVNWMTINKTVSGKSPRLDVIYVMIAAKLVRGK
jgi:hypothetical protein